MPWKEQTLPIGFLCSSIRKLRLKVVGIGIFPLTGHTDKNLEKVHKLLKKDQKVPF
jgi:hypothetical protein